VLGAITTGRMLVIAPSGYLMPWPSDIHSSCCEGCSMR
jgi:hypothetical protein